MSRSSRVLAAIAALISTAVTCVLLGCTTSGAINASGSPVSSTATTTISEEPLNKASVPFEGDTASPTLDPAFARLVPATPSPDQPTAPAVDTVVYTVTGRSAGAITYENSTGDTSQVTDTTRLPWKVSFTEPAGTEGFLYVSAQNAGSGTIGCSISINGQVVKQNTSTGAYAIVDCSG